MRPDDPALQAHGAATVDTGQGCRGTGEEIVVGESRPARSGIIAARQSRGLVVDGLVLIGVAASWPRAWRVPSWPVRHLASRRRQRHEHARGRRGGPQADQRGAEMAALGRFYRDVTWNGVIHAGGMGPGTPAMTGVGRAKAKAIQDGRWITLDCEQEQFLDDGTFVLKWQLHWVSG